MLPCSTDRESISSFIKSDSSDLFERGVGGGVSPVCHLSCFGEHGWHFTLLKVMKWHSQVQQEVGIGGGREGELLCPD